VISEEDAKTITAWGFVGSALDTTGNRINDIGRSLARSYSRWLQDLSKRGMVSFIITQKIITLDGEVFFRGGEDGTGRRGVIKEGFQLIGISIFDRTITGNLLYDLSNRLHEDLNVDYLEYWFCGGTISSIRKQNYGDLSGKLIN
jgi:hypothetical protein